MLTALFGIENGGLNLAVNLLILFLVVVYIALIYWVWSDARHRIEDPVLVTTATVLAIVPFVGPIIYSILRPPEYIEDVREREMETKAAELRLRHLKIQSCPRCEHPIERMWLRCPECQTRLKDPCRSCNRPVDPSWAICPYCEARIAPKKRQSAESSARRSPAERVATGRGSERGRSERPTSGPPRRTSSKAGERSSAPAPPGTSGEEKAPAPRRRSTTPS
jgi:hypothetical protein